MLNVNEIESGFKALNEELRRRGIRGEILLCGGAVMCLVFNARKATKDVDGIFEPSSQIREAAVVVAKELKLPKDWLNDSAKAYFSPLAKKVEVRSWDNLSIWAPTTDYMLAMKCIAARYDTQDRDDVIFLIKKMGIKTKEEVFHIIEKYYPKREIPAKTQFFIEEILSNASFF